MIVRSLVDEDSLQTEVFVRSSTEDVGRKLWTLWQDANIRDDIVSLLEMVRLLWPSHCLVGPKNSALW